MATIVNHLEMFSSIFGAMFVFKLLSNFALKIILEIILELNEDFDVTIQNLERIWLWS